MLDFMKYTSVHFLIATLQDVFHLLFCVTRIVEIGVDSDQMASKKQDDLDLHWVHPRQIQMVTPICHPYAI